MKKSILVILTFVIALIIAGCQYDPTEDIDALLAQIQLEEGLVSDSLTLPTTIEGESITWTSSDDTVMSAIGEISRPDAGDNVKSVTLTASITIEEVTRERVFNFSVQPYSTEEAAYIKLYETLDALAIPEAIDEHLDIPDMYEDVAITWESSDTFILNHEGIINQPLYDSGPVLVTVTMTLTYDGYSIEEILDLSVLPRPESIVTDIRTLDFISLANEYLVDDTDIDIYYINDSQLPYVDIEAFLQVIDGAIVHEIIDIMMDEAMMMISYTVDYDDELYDDDYFELILHFDTNQVIVNRFGFFRGFAESTQTDFGVGLETIDYIYNPTDPVTIDLAHYRFDLVRHEDAGDEVYLMPFQIANLFFTGSMYDVYYNGDKVIGFDTYQLLDDTAAEPITATILNDTSYNDKAMSEALKIDAYNYLVMTFDHFYGLRAYQGVDTYYDVLEPHKENFIHSTDITHYVSVRNIALDMDELHTWFQNGGIYNPLYKPQLSVASLRENSADFYDVYFSDDMRFHCDTSSGIRYYDEGKIAVIFVQRFNVDTPIDFADHVEAIEARGTVEKIVIDLACNGGGIIGTMLQLFGYMTDDPIEYHGKNIGDGSTSTTVITSDIEAREEFDWFILTSPITFSAANLMASIAKDSGVATIIGQRSAGGACSITTNILPGGAIIMMSSPNMLTNDNYEAIEDGIPVDRSISIKLYKDEGTLKNATR